MAKFWEHLKYHEDNIEKHKITEEEIKFLKELQHEMNTQDHVGQADPRYWVIRDYERIYGKKLSSPDGIAVYKECCGDVICETKYEFFNVNKTIESLLSHIKESGYELSDETIERIESAYNMSSLEDILEDLDDVDFIIREYQEIPVDKGFFFTQKAAEEHLRKNDYHYANDAHTYAHTAWRSSEEMLWNILQQVDFDDVAVQILGSVT